MRNRRCNNNNSAIFVGQINYAWGGLGAYSRGVRRKAVYNAVSQQQLMRTAVGRQQFCYR